MSIRRKTRRRLVILIVLVLAAGGGVFGLYRYRTYHRDAQARKKLTDGMAAYRSGDYRLALADIATYLRRFSDDVDAMLTLADARRKVVEPQGKHLVIAMRILERARAVAPDNLEITRRLMALYLQVNRPADAADLADEVLAASPKDPEALWTKSVALDRTGKQDEALAELERYLGQAPDSLKGYLLEISLRVAGAGTAGEKRADEKKSDEEKAEKIRARAEAVANAHGKDPRFGLLVAHALLLTNDSAGAQAKFKTLLNVDFQDEVVLGTMLRDLQMVGLTDEMVRIARRLADKSPQSPYHLFLIRRDYNLGKFDEVVSEVDGLEKQGRVLEPQLAGLRVLALHELGEDEKAKQALAALNDGTDVEAGAAWRDYLSVCVLDPSASLGTRIQTAVDASKKLSRDAYVRYTLGRLYEEAEETIQAIHAYGESAQYSGGWKKPLIRAAWLLLRTGRIQNAILVTEIAHRLNSSDPELKRIWAAVQSLLLPRMGTQNLEKLLAAIGTRPEPELTPLRVAALFRLGRTDEALATIKDIESRDPPVAGPVLLQLAAICNQQSLSAVQGCLAAYDKAYGKTADLAWYELRSAGGKEGAKAALDTLEAARARSDDPEDVHWDVTKLQVLERIDGESAGPKAWAKLSDGHPENLGVQEAVLSSAAAWQDHDLIDRATQRLHDLVGDTGIIWKQARARLLLLGDHPTDDELREAEGLLRYVLARAPDMMQIRKLLAATLERLGDFEGANSQMELAIGASSQPVPLLLETAGLESHHGMQDKALAHIEKALATDGITGAQIRQAAELLLQQGQYEKARDALLRDVKETPEEKSARQLLLARVSVQLGETDRTDALLKSMMEHPSAAVAAFAADYYASRGRTADAKAAMDALASLDIAPERLAMIRAEHERRAGQLAAALDAYQAAVEKAPANAGWWRRYLSAAAQTGDADRWSAVLDAARKALPEDAQFRALDAGRTDLAAAIPLPLLRPLVVEAVENPKAREGCEAAMKAAAGRRESQEEKKALAETAVGIAEKNPESLALHVFALQCLADGGTADAVVALAHRIERLFPTSELPDRILTIILTRQGHWVEALPAAEEWVRRAGGANPEALAALAEVHLRIGNKEKCAEIVGNLRKQGLAPGTVADRVDALRMEVLVDQGRESDALKMLEERIPEKKPWLGVGIRLALTAIQDNSTAVRWLDRFGKLDPGEDVGYPLALAQAWGTLIQRPEVADAGRKHLSSLLARIEPMSGLTSAQLFLLGTLREELGEDGRAGELYERSLKEDPKFSLSANNLAMVELRAGNTKAALEQAQKAVELAPKAPEYRDTLIQVLSALGKDDEVKAQYEECRKLQPKNPRWWIQAAEAQMKRGKAGEPNAKAILLDVNRKFSRPLIGEWEGRIQSIENQLR